MIYNVEGNVVGTDVSPELMDTLLGMSKDVMYINNRGSEYRQSFYDGVHPNRKLSSISATVNLGCHTVMIGDSVDSLIPYIKVTATYADEYTEVVKDYTIQGTISLGNNSITIIYGGKSTTVIVSAVAGLPAGYTRLEYIYTDGRQYMDTGLTSDDVDYAEYEIMVRSQWYVKGGNILSSDNFRFPYLSGDNANGFKSRIAFFHRGNGDNKVSSGSYIYPWDFDERHLLSGYDANGAVSVDGKQLFSVPKGSSSASEPLYIFTGGASKVINGSPDTAYSFMGRLYGMKLYKNNTLIRNYIPCKDSNNEAGLYDIVNDAFLKSASDKRLLRGGEV